MSRRVAVHLRIPAAPLPAAATAVVVDVLRATTTLTVALDAGASRVLPVATPEAGRDLARSRPGALLCGERYGRPIPGYDLGNSPYEYTPERVRGRELVFASSNGSLALIAAARCRRVVIAAFVNASAVLAAVADEPAVEIVCAANESRFAIEDAGLAGWLAAALIAQGAAPAGAAARAAARLAPRGARAVRALVEGAPHARELRRLGPAWDRDVAFAAGLDRIGRAFEVGRVSAGSGAPA